MCKTALVCNHVWVGNLQFTAKYQGIKSVPFFSDLQGGNQR